MASGSYMLQMQCEQYWRETGAERSERDDGAPGFFERRHSTFQNFPHVLCSRAPFRERKRPPWPDSSLELLPKCNGFSLARCPSTYQVSLKPLRSCCGNLPIKQPTKQQVKAWPTWRREQCDHCWSFTYESQQKQLTTTLWLMVRN